MPNNKSTGANVFPAEFNKHFWPSLSPLFIKMTIKMRNISVIPPYVNKALISPPLNWKNSAQAIAHYLSLTQIINKALAMRLETVIPSLVHPDQTGFIKGRLS